MKKEISIIIMLSAFSVSAMAGGEVRLGKSETYDNESGRQAVSQYGKPNLPPVRLNPHPSRP